jgi:hypothetical protein
MSALREVLAVFDIIVNDAQLEAGNKKIDSFVDKLKGIGEAFAAFKIVETISSFGMHVAQAARAAEFGAARIGMGVDQYQKLSQVADNYGLSVEQLQVSTRMFERALSDTGGTVAQFQSKGHHIRDSFKNLGLDPKQFAGKTLDQILPDVADAFKKIEDPISRTAIALRLFGHRGLAILPMLTKGGEELRREFAAAIPVFEDATITSANEATIAGKQLGRTWDNLVDNSFGRAALDVFTWVARKLTDIVLAVKDLTKYSEIGKGILVALGVALTTAGALAVAAWWPVLVPILAVLAAFAALALAVDDLIVFMKGGDSVIADFFDELLGPGGAEKAQAFIKQIWDDFKGFLDELKGKAWSEFLENTKSVIQDIRSSIQGIKDAITWIETHWKQMTEGFDRIAHIFGGGSHDIKATTTIAEALTSPNFQPANVAPPPEIGPPTAAQAATYGSGASGAGNSYHFNGNVDSNELTHKVKRVIEDHNEQKIDNILRDALAGIGGSK